jgi:hypothetical protein
MVIAAANMPVLSDAQWARLAELGLPLEARIDIDDCIASYRNELALVRQASPAPADDRLRKDLDRTRKAAANLADRIQDIGASLLGEILRRVEVERRETLHNVADVKEFRARIELGLVDLRELANSLAIARKQLNQKRGPKSMSQQFARTVAAVIELHMGARIKQSRNKGSVADMLREILAIADEKIGKGGKGAVDKALRMRARQRRGPIKR